jgi:hypothetical protein
MSKEVKADLEGENLEKFNELQDFLEKRSNNRKYGNANTIRLAIELGHERMKELEENRAESIQDFKKWESKIENAVNELKE